MTDFNTDGLIDLGSATLNTRGFATVYAAEEFLQHKPNPGLTID